MKHRAPELEVAVNDGLRHIGRAVPVSDGWEARSEIDGAIGRFPTRREAVSAIAEADRERRGVPAP